MGASRRRYGRRVLSRHDLRATAPTSARSDGCTVCHPRDLFLLGRRSADQGLALPRLRRRTARVSESAQRITIRRAAGSAILGCLRSRPLRPDAGDYGRALWALPRRRDAHLVDDVAVAFDQQLVARRAKCVLPTADASRQVARVDVAEAGGAADLAGAN